MTNKDSNTFFEGAEKLLEIWFTGFNASAEGDLRKIPREKFESLLKLVHCEIISFTRNEHIDAYVLSESSMFVSKRRFILKTCGTTTPLQCLKTLMILVQHYSGFDQVERVFYSRKNFKKPSYQKNIYQNFQQEMLYLDACFQTKGVGYCIENGGDCWYLYSLHSERLNNFFSEKIREPDQTIEILMSDLNPDVMENFRKDRNSTAEQVTKNVGIDKIIPLVEIDDYLFDPCGYSMNGILPNGCYMTIHVTPEPEFSYVSFETNVPSTSYEDIIERVVSIFQPGKFIVTLFANTKSLASQTPKELQMLKKLSAWRQLSNDLCYVANYELTVAFYSKFPS